MHKACNCITPHTASRPPQCTKQAHTTTTHLLSFTQKRGDGHAQQRVLRGVWMVHVSRLAETRSLYLTPVNSCCTANSSAAALKPGQNTHNNSAHVMSSTAAWRTQREGQWEHSRAAREVGCNDNLRTRSRTPAPVHKMSAQHAAHHHHTPAKLHSKARRRACANPCATGCLEGARAIRVPCTPRL
jgi:hypothetical protein